MVLVELEQEGKNEKGHKKFLTKRPGFYWNCYLFNVIQVVKQMSSIFVTCVRDDPTQFRSNIIPRQYDDGKEKSLMAM